MRNNTNNGKNRWSTLPSSVKLAIGVMIGIGFLAFFHVANEKDEQTKKLQYEREARKRMKQQQLYEKLEAERQERIKKAEAYQITDEQRRMIRENSRRQAELDARAPELLEKYNRGRSLPTRRRMPYTTITGMNITKTRTLKTTTLLIYLTTVRTMTRSM